MLFNSTRFVIFFLGVLLFYYIMPRRIRWVWLLITFTWLGTRGLMFCVSPSVWLLITGYVFYMAWNVKYAVL